METQLKPSQIFFSHTKISSRFTGCSKKLTETLHELIDCKTSIDTIPKIKVFYWQVNDKTKYLSENNRRLWVFKQLESKGLLNQISVRLVKSTKPKHIINTYSLTAKFI
jgi:hypothetical protein